jgi:hypothetical protein
MSAGPGAPATVETSIPGVGPFIAAKILGEVGDPSRVRSKPAFAVLSGTAPLSASSGQIQRHRLNRGGNRQLNWALHYIALVQCRIMPEAQAYMDRAAGSGQVPQGGHALSESGTIRTWSTVTSSPTRGGRSWQLDNIEGLVRLPIGIDAPFTLPACQRQVLSSRGDGC